ncbi:MAG: hypothetical protein E7812_08915 [Phenylobacterium sp.]|nr:MAG: hypothetical protein E7812_08915 [Phenylobacterium sp.]
MGQIMELPEVSYLYTVALIGMTFIGFSVIVMLLRQTVGRKLRTFDALFAHVYMEFGLIVTVAALLPPLLVFWGLPPALVWRASAGLVAIPIILFGLTYPSRRRKAAGEPTPLYVWVNVALVLLMGLIFLATSTGLWPMRSAALFLSALTAFLVFSVGTWLRALSLVVAPT